MTVAAQITNARLKLKLSLRELAAQLKVTHTTIHAWETRRAPVPFARLSPLIDALRLDEDQARALRMTWTIERDEEMDAQLERHRERLAAKRTAS